MASRFLVLLACLGLSQGPAAGRPATRPPLPPLAGAARPDFIQTTAGGDWLRSLPPPKLRKGLPSGGLVLEVDPGSPRQTVLGIGGALTESSAYVLASLTERRRARILDLCFGPEGADFQLARIPIGACDFSVEGRYSYDDTAGDTALAHFSIAHDREGFPGARNPRYALLPLLRDALARAPRLKVVASPWTAPAWMKDNQDWYGRGRGGTLLPEHFDTFARYMVRYLEAYRHEGVPIWAITPENEPLGNGGQWESMEFSDEALRDYVRDHLGPRLEAAGLGGVKVIQFDHNRDADALRYARTLLGDPAAARYVWGTGLHWYNATDSANPEILDQLQQAFPTKALLHTEGCIDGIGTPENAPGGEFRGWKNPVWWWTPSARDWGFYWAPPAERAAHPPYAAVQRYARDLIEGLNHGLAGWIDWNLVLDRRGGPNHVGNYCAAPIMVDTAGGDTFVAPIYALLAHVSRYIRPGDRILRVAARAPDAFHAASALSADGRRLVVVAFNGSAIPRPYTIRVGPRVASVVIPPQAIQTLCFQLAEPAPRPGPRRIPR